MQKNIKFNGLANVPSDRDCPEGQLAMAINLVNDNSGLEAPQVPELLFTADGAASGKHIQCTHTVAGQKMYILANENNIGYYDPDLVYHEIVSGIEDIQFIKPLGNALVVGTEGDLLYAIYKDGGYTWLGAMPELVGLSFGLEGTIYSGEETEKYSGPNGTYIPGGITFPDADQNILNTIVMAPVNVVIAKIKEDKRFIDPFFVRYAYRLYDGSYTKHSAPILMVPCDRNPLLARLSYRHDVDKGATLSEFKITVTTLACELDYRIDETPSGLAGWSDIIRGIDVFISAPIQKYNPNGDVDGAKSKAYSLLEHTTICKPTDISGAGYGRYTYGDILGGMYGGSFRYYFNLPDKEDDVYMEQIKNASLFYKIASIDIQELLSPDINRVKMSGKMSSDALVNLVNKQVLVDEYQSHYRTTGSFGYVYNSRLNIAGITQALFSGFNPGSAVCHYGASSTDVAIYYHIRKQGDVIIVSNHGNLKGIPLFLYYPDPDAYMADVYMTTASAIYHHQVKLTAHSGLNGAFWFNGFTPETRVEVTEEEIIAISDDPFVSLPSKIITSDPLNPFFWPVEGVNTVGSGSILGMASATKALSQGQFGQFPLYVFTSEGVWAMQVSNTGLFSSVHPVTRDILSTPGQILQMDNDIAFMTKKGIMVLGGSESVCITDILGSKEAFRRNTMSGIDNLVYVLGVNIYPASGINSLINGMRYGLSDILLTGELAYDYTNEKIYAFIPGTPYAFIFNKRSKEWTTAAMSSNVLGVFSDYPDSLVMLQGYKVVNISTKRVTFDQRYFALITRPIKIAEAGSEALKKITRLIVRGTFSPEPGADSLPTVCCALYGTMDYKTYAPVASSVNHAISSIRGKHYKAFRAVVVGRLFQGESITGMDVDYEVKPAAKIE